MRALRERIAYLIAPWLREDSISEWFLSTAREARLSHVEARVNRDTPELRVEPRGTSE